MSAQVNSQAEPAGSKFECIILPGKKPPSSEIRSILKTHYDSVAHGFDEFNNKITRGKYLNAVDQLVATSLSQLNHLEHFLSVGAGTGHRELSIQAMSGDNFHITCVDLSSKMCEIASSKGLRAICGSVEELDLVSESFDACIYLNAFEALDNKADRIAALRSLNHCLKSGVPLFLDVVNIDACEGWGARVRKHFQATKMSELGYDLGDVFYRRTDCSAISYMHCFSKEEIEELFIESGFQIQQVFYLEEDTGENTGPNAGRILFIAVKTSHEHSASLLLMSK